MAYTAGNTILDDEYNNFATDVNTVGNTYGQTSVSTVSAGGTITATQWATLLNTISTYANHQNTSITAITNPNAGNTIAILSALSGNITSIGSSANLYNAAANGTDSSSVNTRTTGWNTSVTVTHTVTFADLASMQNWFNSGGLIKMAFSRTGGTAENKNTGWSNLCTASGTVVLSANNTAKTISGISYNGTTKIGGSGTPTVIASTVGMDELTTTDTTLFTQYDATVSYTTNYIAVAAKRSGGVLTITTTYTDDANTDTDETVDGTLTTTLTASPPSTTYISDSWGTVTLGNSQTGS